MDFDCKMDIFVSIIHQPHFFMKILIKILLFVLVLAILALGVGFFLPSSVHMERSTEIAASPKVVFEQINSFKNFNKWSPWAKLDTATVYNYEGSETGVGAKMSWTSDNPNVGKGSQEIIVSEPYEKITNQMIFGDFEPASASFELSETENGTKVVWSYDQDMGLNIIGRYFGLMMDKMLGPDYESGLADLKEMIEDMPKYKREITVEMTEGQKYISINEYVDNDPVLISTKMASNYGELMNYLQRAEVDIVGYPFTIYHDYTETGMNMECALPIEADITSTDERIQVKERYIGKVVKAIHVGSNEGLYDAHNEVGDYIAHNKLTNAGDPWEVYVTDAATETDTAKWITHIYYPVK
jgi:effector-binding domain-containing protein